MLFSNKIQFGKKDFKYFIGYRDVKKIRPLCIILPKVGAYRRYFDKTKCMYFLIKVKQLLEKYNEIWQKVSNIIKKNFAGEPVYNEKYLKNKIKCYKRKLTQIFTITNYQKKDVNVLVYQKN